MSVDLIKKTPLISGVFDDIGHVDWIQNDTPGKTMQTTELNLLDSTFLNIDRRPDTWSVHVELRVAGRIDAGRLAAAVRAATNKHPIARARLQHYHSGATSNYWEIPDELDHLPLTEFDAADDAAVAAARARLQSIQVPLTLAPCFMVYLVHQTGGDWLMVNVPHAMADGLSTFRIIQSMLRHYAGEADPVPDFDPLSVRDLGKLAGSKSAAQRLDRIKLLIEHLGKSNLAPARVKAKGVSVKNADELPGYGVEPIALSPAETKQFMARRAKPATINDMLLAALALTIREWNARNAGSTGRIAMMMPVNLRPEAWWFEVVGNFSSYVSLSLAEELPSDFNAMTQEVCQQTTEFKDAGAAGTLIDLLQIPKYFPSFLKARLKELFPLFGNKLMETTWLSNLGRLASCPVMGDAGRVTELYFTPPAPMPCSVSVGAASMEDRMYLALRYRHAALDAAAAREFAALFKQTLLG